MQLITLDMETYYSKDYGLKKLTTEAYIRDEKFEVIGVATKVNGQPTRWFSGSHAETKAYLDSLDIPNSYLLAHNAAFDGAILAWQFGIKPKYYLDTLSMARPITGATVGGSLAALAKKFNLGAKGTEVLDALGKRREDFQPQELAAYGEYCKNDVEITYALYHILKEQSTPKEQYIIDLMVRMFTDPVIKLDIECLNEHLANVQAKKEKLMGLIDSSIGRDALMSNPKFAEVLVKLGVTPPMKTSLRTGKETYAFGKTDVEFKALLEHEDPRVQAVVSARLGVKSTLEETRTESFIAIGRRGALPIMLNYYGAHTGRACLVGDTEISVLRNGIPTCIMLQDLLSDDLVWDGEAYVAHDGLVDQGELEVIEYDGIIGTPDHRVYVYEVEGEVELREASKRGYTLRTAEVPSNYEIALGSPNRSGKEQAGEGFI